MKQLSSHYSPKTEPPKSALTELRELGFSDQYFICSTLQPFLLVLSQNIDKILNLITAPFIAYEQQYY